MSASKPQPHSEDPQAAFFKVEIALSSTFADIAETNLKNRNTEAANGAIAKAQQGLKTILDYLKDPKHSRHLNDQDRKRVEDEAGQLQGRVTNLAAQIRDFTA